MIAALNLYVVRERNCTFELHVFFIDIPRDKCMYTMKHRPMNTVISKKVEEILAGKYNMIIFYAD